MNLALIFHLLAAVVWVGGMFFAYMALRPVAATLLQPPERLSLWAGVFSRFFPWVWLAIVLLFASGLSMVVMLGGINSAAPAVHAMLGIALVMTSIFGYIYFRLFPALKQSVASAQWQQAGNTLASIRKLIAFNLSLGLIEVVIGALGRF